MCNAKRVLKLSLAVGLVVVLVVYGFTLLWLVTMFRETEWPELPIPFDVQTPFWIRVESGRNNFGYYYLAQIDSEGKERRMPIVKSAVDPGQFVDKPVFVKGRLAWGNRKGNYCYPSEKKVCEQGVKDIDRELHLMDIWPAHP